MKDWIGRHRPSPGVVLGTVALVAALAGTAVAGESVSNKGLTKKKVTKIADKEIKKLAPGLAVASADSAANATNATNAANADKLDGHDAACPAGTFLQNGVCFDTNVRFPMTPWPATDCADAGGFTPSVSQLESIRNVPGVNLGASGDGHWTDDVWEDDNGTTVVNKAETVIDNGAVEPRPVGNQRQLRCAFPLVR